MKGYNLKMASILVLEDSIDRFQTMLGPISHIAGMSHQSLIHWERDATSALQRLKARQYNIIFLDHDLENSMDKNYAGTGMDIVNFLVENVVTNDISEDQSFKNHPMNALALVVVHSLNIVRSNEMLLRLKDSQIRRLKFTDWNNPGYVESLWSYCNSCLKEIECLYAPYRPYTPKVFAET